MRVVKNYHTLKLILHQGKKKDYFQCTPCSTGYTMFLRKINVVNMCIIYQLGTKSLTFITGQQNCKEVFWGVSICIC